MLTLRAQAELSGEIDEPSALDYAEHWLADGHTFIELAHSLQNDSEKDSQGSLDPILTGGGVARMLRSTFGQVEADAAFARARARGSHALVEQTHEIADEDVKSSEDASRARNRIGTRQWAASAYERNTFGQRGNQVAVQINLGQMHLDALRHRAIEQVGVNLLDGQITQALPESTVDADIADQTDSDIVSIDIPTS